MRYLTPLIMLFFVSGCVFPSKKIHNKNIKKLSGQQVTYPFKWIVYGDSRPPNNPVHLRLLEQMKRHKPVMIFNTGDFVDWSTYPEYKDYFKLVDGYEYPIFSVLGNHDDRLRGVSHFRRLFGAEDFCFDYGNSRFICMRNSHTFYYGFSDRQIGWLDAKLGGRRWFKLFRQRVPDKHKFVFVHAPIAGDFAHMDHLFHIDEQEQKNDEAFVRLLEKYNVKIIFYGHEHLYARAKNSVISGGGGAPLHGDGRKPPDFISAFHYLLVTTQEDGEATVDLYELDQTEPTEGFSFRR